MKKVLLMIILLFAGCQKDFYLDDLNEAQDRINQLEGEVNMLISRIDHAQNQIDNLTTLNSNLQSQLNTISNDYNNALISLEEANELITELEDQIAIYEGVKRGYYYLESGVSIKSHNNNLNQWGFPDTNRYVKITDPQTVITLQKKPVLLDVETEEEIHYIKEISRYDYGYGVVKSIEVIGVNKVTVIDSTWDCCGSWSVRKLQLRKLQAEEIDPYLISPEKLTEIFLENGKGIYSDPLYRTIKWNDIHDFVRVFKEDAKRYGKNYDHAGSDYYYVGISKESIEPIAYASYGCGSSSIWVQYGKDSWSDYPDSPYSPAKLDVMYHELGHSVLGYKHPYGSTGAVAPGWNGKHDIMGYYDVPWFGGGGATFEDKMYERTDWSDTVNRFINGIDHQRYGCYTGKGQNEIIFECEIK